MTDSPTSPIAQWLRVDRLPQNGVTVTIDADEEQRAALARAHGLLAVERFSAELTARPWRGDGVRVSGRLDAQVKQECVVTLEPLSQRISDEISALFVPQDSRLARMEQDGGEIVLDAEGEDLPEPLAGGRIDIGALAEEFFALGIDPYPRKPGVAADWSDPEEPGETSGGPLQEELKKLRRSG